MLFECTQYIMYILYIGGIHYAFSDQRNSQGKRKNKISNEMLEILESKNANKIIFYSRSFFKKWKEEDLANFKDIYSFVNVQLVETINKVIEANSYKYRK